MKIATKTQRPKATLKGLYINESFVPSCLCGNHFHSSPGEGRIMTACSYSLDRGNMQFPFFGVFIIVQVIEFIVFYRKRTKIANFHILNREKYFLQEFS